MSSGSRVLAKNLVPPAAGGNEIDHGANSDTHDKGGGTQTREECSPLCVVLIFARATASAWLGDTLIRPCPCRQKRRESTDADSVNSTAYHLHKHTRLVPEPIANRAAAVTIQSTSQLPLIGIGQVPRHAFEQPLEPCW
jgi:hypothetical protein